MFKVFIVLAIAFIIHRWRYAVRQRNLLVDMARHLYTIYSKLTDATPNGSEHLTKENLKRMWVDHYGKCTIPSAYLRHTDMLAFNLIIAMANNEREAAVLFENLVRLGIDKPIRGIRRKSTCNK